MALRLLILLSFLATSVAAQVNSSTEQLRAHLLTYSSKLEDVLPSRSVFTSYSLSGAGANPGPSRSGWFWVQSRRKRLLWSESESQTHLVIECNGVSHDLATNVACEDLSPTSHWYGMRYVGVSGELAASPEAFGFKPWRETLSGLVSSATAISTEPSPLDGCGRYQMSSSLGNYSYYLVADLREHGEPLIQRYTIRRMVNGVLSAEAAMDVLETDSADFPVVSATFRISNQEGALTFGFRRTLVEPPNIFWRDTYELSGRVFDPVFGEAVDLAATGQRAPVSTTVLHKELSSIPGAVIPDEVVANYVPTCGSVASYLFLNASKVPVSMDSVLGDLPIKPDGTASLREVSNHLARHGVDCHAYQANGADLRALQGVVILLLIGDYRPNHFVCCYADGSSLALHDPPRAVNTIPKDHPSLGDLKCIVLSASRASTPYRHPYLLFGLALVLTGVLVWLLACWRGRTVAAAAAVLVIGSSCSPSGSDAATIWTVKEWSDAYITKYSLMVSTRVADGWEVRDVTSSCPCVDAEILADSEVGEEGVRVAKLQLPSHSGPQRVVVRLASRGSEEERAVGVNIHTKDRQFFAILCEDTTIHVGGEVGRTHLFMESPKEMPPELVIENSAPQCVDAEIIGLSPPSSLRRWTAQLLVTRKVADHGSCKIRVVMTNANTGNNIANSVEVTCVY